MVGCFGDHYLFHEIKHIWVFIGGMNLGLMCLFLYEIISSFLIHELVSQKNEQEV